MGKTVSVSAVILNWNRPLWLRRVILPLLARHPLVEEIHVSHGREQTCFTFESPRCEIVHRHDWDLNERYGLALRFVAAREVKNDAVLILDDDLVVAGRSITGLKASFDAEPHTLHGIFGRRISPAYEYSYDGYEEGETPLVLTRCLMMHRSYADVFLEAEPSAAGLIARGVPKWNGEDIFYHSCRFRGWERCPMPTICPTRTCSGGVLAASPRRKCLAVMGRRWPTNPIVHGSPVRPSNCSGSRIRSTVI